MLQEYYNRRAPVYEEKYRRDEPVRQAEQAEIAETLKRVFAGRRVLEIACGTGYWTEAVAQVARRVVATDTSREMLDIAIQKGFAEDKVEFRVADAYDLAAVPGEFDAGLANFWFSHVRKAEIESFLTGFHRRLGAGAVVFMADDMYMSGVGGEFVQLDVGEDTYKKRWLPDGSEYVIVKNYYDAQGLQAVFAPYAEELQVHTGACHWWVNYSVKSDA